MLLFLNSPSCKCFFAPVAALCLFSSAFFSCALDFSLYVNDAAAQISLDAECSPNLEKAVKSAAQMSESQSLFDENSIKEKLADVQTRDVSVKAEKSPARVKVKFSANSADEILPIAAQSIKFNRKAKKLTIDFNSEIAEECLSYFPEQISQLSDLLMSPLFTGEKLDEAEYRENVALVFGNAIANDLDKSRVKFQIEFDGDVKNAYTSKKNFAKIEMRDKSVQFEIPLAKILCLQDNLQITVELE